MALALASTQRLAVGHAPRARPGRFQGPRQLSMLQGPSPEASLGLPVSAAAESGMGRSLVIEWACLIWVPVIWQACLTWVV